MRKLNQSIDRFCALHPRWGISGLMRYIIGANVALYLLGMFAGGGTLNFLAMNPAAVLDGEIWRVLTFVLLPESGGFWLLLSSMFYYWLGESLERIWGSAKFTFYYLSGTLLTALAAILVYLIDGKSLYIAGASFVNSALFFAFALYNPNAMVSIYFIIPIKMKWLAWFEAALYAVSVLRSIMVGAWGMALLPMVAMLNLFVFFAPELGRKREQIFAHNRPQAVQFRKAVKEQQRQKGYNHKCTVCGRTDADFPQLQFRYCSKCAGYHCYCEDHIFNHTHFTE